MRLISDSFKDGEFLPARLAFSKFHPATRMEFSENRNPHLKWSNLPVETRSIAIVCHDPDVPAQFDKVNKEGVMLPVDMVRMDFFHWAWVDIPPSVSEVKEGEMSNGVSIGGKPGPNAARGTRQALNDYTMAFEGDANMKGSYFGYDGPCPPWNDTRIHHYHFVVYALSCAVIPLSGVFNCRQVLDVIKPFILESASLVGKYSLNQVAVPK